MVLVEAEHERVRCGRRGLVELSLRIGSKISLRASRRVLAGYKTRKLVANQQIEAPTRSVFGGECSAGSVES